MKNKNFHSNVIKTKLTKLEEQSKFMAMSVQQSSEGMAYADLDGNLIFINKAWYEMHGYKSDKELLGKNLKIFHSKKQMEKEVIPFNDIVMKNGTNSGEVGHITKNGKVFPTLMTVNLLIDENGNPFALAGISKDITERKKAEHVLKDSEEKYRTLFSNMSNGFALHKIVLNENKIPIDYTFIEVNNAFENQTGLKKGNIIGKNVTKVLPGIDKDTTDWIGIYGKVALTQKNIHFENYAGPLNKWYSVHAYCPQKGYFATIFEDITKRKQTEEKLKNRNKELETWAEVTTDRELFMLELKKEINELLEKTGEKPKYKIPT